MLKLPLAGLQVDVITMPSSIDADGSELLGEADTAKMQIRLNENLLKDIDRLGETFLHEIIHMVEVMYEVNLSEEQVGVLGLGLHQMLKDFMMMSAIKAMLEQ
jgi:hypothetical protein